MRFLVHERATALNRVDEYSTFATPSRHFNGPTSSGPCSTISLIYWRVCARETTAQFRSSGNWSWSRNFVAIADERSPGRWISCRLDRCSSLPSSLWNDGKYHSVLIISTAPLGILFLLRLLSWLAMSLYVVSSDEGSTCFFSCLLFAWQ